SSNEVSKYKLPELTAS
uniref:Uncharacterized protein n=1 Tax=Meloidogyne hapla TaxID=6305 RepID=A0A1I8BHY8_MELHA